MLRLSIRTTPFCCRACPVSVRYIKTIRMADRMKQHKILPYTDLRRCWKGRYRSKLQLRTRKLLQRVNQDFAVSISGGIGLLGGQTAYNEQKALKQLHDSIYMPTFAVSMPMGQDRVPALVSTGDSITIYAIGVESNRAGSAEQLVVEDVKSYFVHRHSERMEFVIDLMKLILWFRSLDKPARPGILLPGIPVHTPNGHKVELTKNGVLKTFASNRISFDTFAVMQSIYATKTERLERGCVMASKNQVLITTVGVSLSHAIHSGVVNLKKDIEEVKQNMALAVQELHALGYAHCDVSVDNFFVQMDGRMFLGDLEYARCKEAVAPSNMYRAIPEATLAADLDCRQLERAYKELELLELLQ